MSPDDGKKKPPTWVRIRCPRSTCKKRVGELFIDLDDQLKVLDMATFDEPIDPKFAIEWTNDQSIELGRKREAITRILGEVAVDYWPASQRAVSPKQARSKLGIAGPKTQYDGIVQVGSPGGGITLTIAEEDDGSLSVNAQHVDAWEYGDPSEPWIFKCSCGIERVILYSNLVNLVSNCLSAGDHQLVLP